MWALQWERHAHEDVNPSDAQLAPRMLVPQLESKLQLSEQCVLFQVTRRRMNVDGAAVAEHVARQIAAMDALLDPARTG